MITASSQTIISSIEDFFAQLHVSNSIPSDRAVYAMVQDAQALVENFYTSRNYQILSPSVRAAFDGIHKAKKTATAEVTTLRKLVSLVSESFLASASKVSSVPEPVIGQVSDRALPHCSWAIIAVRKWNFLEGMSLEDQQRICQVFHDALPSMTLNNTQPFCALFRNNTAFVQKRPSRQRDMLMSWLLKNFAKVLRISSMNTVGSVMVDASEGFNSLKGMTITGRVNKALKNELLLGMEKFFPDLSTNTPVDFCQ